MKLFLLLARNFPIPTE